MSGEGNVPLGFIGLGRMGRHMASRLLAAGNPLFVYDTRPEAIAELVHQGASAGQSPAAVAEKVGTVFVSLPTPDVVYDVACGPGGLIEGRRLRIFVDLSTTGQTMEQRIAVRLREAGVECVDAPVSGGVAGAEAGSLTLMLAGDGDVVSGLRPFFETIGRGLFVVGTEPGLAQTAKVANNLLSACAVLVTAEATALGVKAGIDARTLLKIFSASTGANTATSDKFPKQVLSRKFDHGFKLKLLEKDLRLCLADAQRCEVPMVLGSAIHQLWSVAASQATDDTDMTEIVRLVETWANITIAGEATADGH